RHGNSNDVACNSRLSGVKKFWVLPMNRWMRNRAVLEAIGAACPTLGRASTYRMTRIRIPQNASRLQNMEDTPDVRCVYQSRRRDAAGLFGLETCRADTTSPRFAGNPHLANRHFLHRR